MNVVCEQDVQIERVWYDVSSGQIFIQTGEFVSGIALARIPDSDFESRTPIRHLRVHPSRTAVVCVHEDGNETWFPADMWLPGGFNPP